MHERRRRRLARVAAPLLAGPPGATGAASAAGAAGKTLRERLAEVSEVARQKAAALDKQYDISGKAQGERSRCPGGSPNPRGVFLRIPIEYVWNMLTVAHKRFVRLAHLAEQPLRPTPQARPTP